jgi:hypothetical protein
MRQIIIFLFGVMFDYEKKQKNMKAASDLLEWARANENWSLCLITEKSAYQMKITSTSLIGCSMRSNQRTTEFAFLKRFLILLLGIESYNHHKLLMTF